VEVLIDIVSGAAGAAAVGGIFSIIMWVLNRKAKKEDSAQDTNTANCLARGEEIRELRKDTDRIIAALRLDYYNQIKKLAKKYIARGHIYVEEYEDFSRMYDMYHDPDKLDGNGLLKALKEDVDQLEKKVH
jgi:hypothetical protein